MSQDVIVTLGDWTVLGPEATRIRHVVFVDEQKVPVEIELDAFDSVSLHAIARDGDGMALGTGRLLPDGHIGRMAVLAPGRGRGVGSRILTALIAAQRQRGDAESVLNAQTHAIAFYARFGYQVASDVYDDAGIPHVTMRCRLG